MSVIIKDLHSELHILAGVKMAEYVNNVKNILKRK
jgi:hypothetical protein